MRGRWCSLPSVGRNGRAVTSYGITQRVPGKGGVQTLVGWSFLGGWEVSAITQLMSQAD